MRRWSFESVLELSLPSCIFGYFSESLGLFRFVTKQFCLFRLFRYKFETPKQTEISSFWFHETNRNKRETDLVSVCFGFYIKNQCCVCLSVYRTRRWPALQTISKIRNKYSQKRNCAATILISTLMCLWAIYIFSRSICIFCCRKICGSIVGIYISLTDTWMWKLGLRSRNSQKKNVLVGFSLQRVGISARNCIKCISHFSWRTVPTPC